MNDTIDKTDRGVLDAQQAHWQTTFMSQTQMFGVEPSYAARQTAALFREEGRKKILELGSGQGRDTRFFLQKEVLKFSRWIIRLRARRSIGERRRRGWGIFEAVYV